MKAADSTRLKNLSVNETFSNCKSTGTDLILCGVPYESTYHFSIYSICDSSRLQEEKLKLSTSKRRLEMYIL